MTGFVAGLQVTVLADATASQTEEVQAANLYDMRNIGVDTPTVAEWEQQLQQQAAEPLAG